MGKEMLILKNALPKPVLGLLQANEAGRTTDLPEMKVISGDFDESTLEVNRILSESLVNTD